MTELIRVEYEDAVRWLEKVAGGIIKLGSGEAGTPKTTSNAVRFQSGGRQFGRDKTNWGAF